MSVNLLTTVIFWRSDVLPYAIQPTLPAPPFDAAPYAGAFAQQRAVVVPRPVRARRMDVRSDVLPYAIQPTLPAAPFDAAPYMGVFAQQWVSVRSRGSASRSLDVRRHVQSRIAGGVAQFEAKVAPAVPEVYEVYRLRERRTRDVRRQGIAWVTWAVGAPGAVTTPVALGGTLSVSGAVGKQAAPVLSGTLGLAGTLSQQAGLLRTGTVAVAGSLDTTVVGGFKAAWARQSNMLVGGAV